MYKSERYVNRKGGDRGNAPKKKERRGAGYLGGTLSATGSGAIDIDIQTGEAARGDHMKKEAFGSLRDLISQHNLT